MGGFDLWKRCDKHMRHFSAGQSLTGQDKDASPGCGNGGQF